MKNKQHTGTFHNNLNSILNPLLDVSKSPDIGCVIVEGPKYRYIILLEERMICQNLEDLNRMIMNFGDEEEERVVIMTMKVLVMPVMMMMPMERMMKVVLMMIMAMERTMRVVVM